MTVELTDLQYDVIQFMVYSLDSKGYMEENLEDVAARFDTEVAFVEEQLKLLQGLDPVSYTHLKPFETGRSGFWEDE